MAVSLLLFLMAVPAVAQPHRSQHSPLSPAQTREAERELSARGYWTGPIDGVFDPASEAALIAFQKWEGRAITGQLSVAESEAIRTSTAPTARELGYEHAEVDLDRQVFLWVHSSGRVKVLPVSTGTGKSFMSQGQESVAYTPRGRFLVYDKGIGWESGELGAVYYPNGISGGIAIHGSRNVPNQPASHGCIRIPMFAAREISELLRLGTIVLVYDKVTFVSAIDWVENPTQKQAAMADIIAMDDEFSVGPPVTNPKLIRRRLRPKPIRA